MANKSPDKSKLGTEGMKVNTKKQDPRVFMFKQFYLSPTSTTFWNVRGSALRAGYSTTYADNITVQCPKWWLELQEDADFERAEMLRTAQRNLNNTLKKEPDNDTQLKIKTDVSKFVSERLGKEHYSTRSEVTGADGRKLFTNETASDKDIALDTLFIGVASDESATK